MDESDKAILSAKIRKRCVVADGGCVEWTGARTAPTLKSPGYGVVTHNGKRWLTHRAIWVVERGEIPAGVLVLHSCDNPPCCNLEHLRLGTHADNVADAVARKRRDPAFVVASRTRQHDISGNGRIRVICSCGWAGRRVAAGGPCKRCGAPTVAAVKRAPNGPRKQMVVMILRSTAEALTSREAALLLDEAAAAKSVQRIAPVADPTQ